MEERIIKFWKGPITPLDYEEVLYLCKNCKLLGPEIFEHLYIVCFDDKNVKNLLTNKVSFDIVSSGYVSNSTETNQGFFDKCIKYGSVGCVFDFFEKTSVCPKIYLDVLCESFPESYIEILKKALDLFQRPNVTISEGFSCKWDDKQESLTNMSEDKMLDIVAAMSFCRKKKIIPEELLDFKDFLRTLELKTMLSILMIK